MVGLRLSAAEHPSFSAAQASALSLPSLKVLCSSCSMGTLFGSASYFHFFQ